jgi:hypothetical protein
VTSGPYLLPLISQRDYGAFSRLNDSDLPETYEGWFKVHARMKVQGSQTGYILEQRQVIRSLLRPTRFSAEHEQPAYFRSGKSGWEEVLSTSKSSYGTIS